VGVNPHKMNDDEFDRVTSKYRLVRIRLKERLSGSGGPGELAWVWIPLALVGLLFLYWKRPRK